MVAQWALIAKQMNGRTDNSIKKRYYSTMRRVSNGGYGGGSGKSGGGGGAAAGGPVRVYNKNDGSYPFGTRASRAFEGPRGGGRGGGGQEEWRIRP